MQIDSHVKMPKQITKQQQRVDKVFADYAEAYGALFVCRPSGFRILENGYIAPVLSKRQQPGMSLRRMKELTRMYQGKLNNK